MFIHLKLTLKNNAFKVTNQFKFILFLNKSHNKFILNMKKASLSIFLLLGLLLTTLSNGQTVECIKQIYSVFANVNWCQSTSSDVRPINATSSFKVNKNMSWFGYYDWSPYILRDGYLIHNLMTTVTCFSSEPISGKLYAGKSYELAIKCTDIPLALAKKDLLYFDIFQDSSHKVAELAYAIPIPGYSTPGDAILTEEQLNSIKKQAEILRTMKPKRQNQIRIEEQLREE